MSVIVTDAGFGPDEFTGVFLQPDRLSAAAGDRLALDLPGEIAAETVFALLGRAVMVRIGFASFSDGRGFTLARRLRLAGYAGRLRATGYLIADQYAMARRAGFDEVEIAEDLAARQPEDQWRSRADWRAHDHQSRLRDAVAASAERATHVRSR